MVLSSEALLFGVIAVNMFTSLRKYFIHSDENLKITNIFKPLYIVLSILGLFPYSVKFDKNKRGLTIIQKSIYFNSICAVSFLLFICSFLVLHVRYVYHSIGDNSMTREIMTKMNYILELVNFTAFCVVAYFCAFHNRWVYVKIINRIATNLPTNRNIEDVLKHFRFEVTVVVVGSLILLLVLQICINFTRDSTLWKTTLVTVSFLLPQMIQFATIAFYYVLILMLVVFLRSIRECISTLIKDSNNLMDCFVKVETRILTLQYSETLCVKAFELKSDINKAFQAPLLITTLQSFHSIVSEAHIIYHGIAIERALSAHAIINCSFWIIYQFMKMYVLARSGSLIKLEVLKIGQVLHNIPTEKYDLRLLMEIQHFSTLMSCHGAEITVYGFFSLDATFLSRVIASAAMYLIILVQFDKK